MLIPLLLYASRLKDLNCVHVHVNKGISVCIYVYVRACVRACECVFVCVRACVCFCEL